MKVSFPPAAIIVPYYNNPEMLAHQVEVWDKYSGDVTAHLQFVVVDDCSDQPALPILKPLKHRVRLFRFKERWPWNQHQCRNLGAHEVRAPKHLRDTDMWFFMTDIDIVLTAEVAYTLFSKEFDSNYHYTVERTFAPDFVERKVHPNTFMCTRQAYWQINGYDLDLIPVGGGGYGGDGEFSRQLSAICPKRHLKDVLTIGYGRSSRDGEPKVYKDADTQTLDRDEWQLKYREAFNKKRAKGDMRSINPIRTPWERLL